MTTSLLPQGSAHRVGAAADNLKRVIRPRSADGDWTGSPSLHRMHAYLETKTVWHPAGT